MSTPPPAPVFTKPALPEGLAALLTFAFLAVLIRTAWMSDDALITLRTVMNVTHGFGLRYNIAERVQTFTHPLWLGVVTAMYYVTANVYYAAFASSILLSAAAFWMGVTRAASGWQAAVVAVILFFSRAFVDFSTSGLENPLSYALLAVFLGVFLASEREAVPARPARALTRLWTIASLLYLTRPDDVLLVAPLLVLATWRLRGLRAIRSVLIGLLPAIAWTLFAILYYGFPFPNTAYAKLAMGIERSELWTQGMLYLVDSLDRDPLTLTTIAFAVLLALTQKRPAARALAAGVVLYLVYVVSIGGDFMAGRFLAVPLFGAALLIGTLARGPRPMWIAAGVALIAVGSAGSHLPLWSNSAFGDSGNKPSGIIDERGVYFRDKSLVLAKRATFREPDWPTARKEVPPPRVLPTCGLMGTSGLDFGPYTHLLDECALADPLLAHLPALHNPEWRTGHYRRLIPAGYQETLETGENRLKDRGLSEYYNHLSAVTRADRIWSSARLKEIVALNRGKYDRLIDRTFYRYGSVAALNELAIRRPDGTLPGDAAVRTLTQPLAVLSGDRPPSTRVEIALDSDDQYRLTFIGEGRVRSTVEVGPVPQHRRAPGLVNYTVEIPPRASERGFDVLLVSPVAGDNKYAIGHVLFR